jgi:hypothetical protein
MTQFGVGELIALTFLAELGDGSTRASLTIARKLARRSYHLLNNLGADARAPVQDITQTSRAPASRLTFTDADPSGQLPQLLRHPRVAAALTKTERSDTPAG